MPARLGALVAIFAFGLLLCWPAAALTVRVRGGTHIDLLAAETSSGTIIRGQIVDDAGASLSGVSVQIEALDAGGRPVTLEPPAICEGMKANVPRLERGAYVVSANERGDFCVKRTGAKGAASYRARFIGNNFYDASDERAEPTPESEQRARTILRFESPPSEIDLDRSEATLVVSLKVDRLDVERLALGASIKREGLTILLVNERGDEVAKGSTSGDGRARFSIPGAAAGPPGNGELKAKFAGDTVLAPSNALAPIMRFTVASLQTTERLEGDPDGGMALDVDVVSAHGVVDGGVVEAHLGADAVGTGAVKDGKARVLVTFGGQRGEAPITLRYLPAAPWWRAGKTVQVTIAIKGPSPLRHIVFGGIAALLTAWIVMKWRRAPQRARPESTSLNPPSGRPEILVVDRPSGLRGWRGVVADAHEGYCVEGALLQVVLPTFDSLRVLAETRSDITGAFAIEMDEVEGARLVVEGDLHAPYEQVLPPPSVLRVALVTRRRALLDRLVRWAKSRGGSYDSPREPTPGHVRRVAARAESAEVEAWARKLEHTAFGHAPVTRDAEHEVRAVEPKPRTGLPGQDEPKSPDQGPRDLDAADIGLGPLANAPRQPADKPRRDALR